MSFSSPSSSAVGRGCVSPRHALLVHAHLGRDALGVAHLLFSHMKTKKIIAFSFFSLLALHARPFLPLPTMGAQAWHEGQSDSFSHLRRHCPPEQTWDFRSQLEIFIFFAYTCTSMPIALTRSHIALARSTCPSRRTSWPWCTQSSRRRS